MVAPTDIRTDTLLPEQFADLERFADWVLATEPERYAKRLASSMDQMQDLYDTVFARLQDALAYLDTFEWPDLPDDARNLFHLLQSLVMVSFPIEVWKQPRVPDSGAAYLDIVHEPMV
ncbi:hypothetical protein [Skermania piniformis]|uniref:Xaa-Pro dipeptidase n=1 Tax=Skermania pinensis TaxID=39122 RepID=A0ABX8SBN1_9ACTN|nr:hypothetical protein [Skermania piniformis]QXQ15269.1 hypothetical protein KV203_08115 [Skermania piniformis]